MSYKAGLHNVICDVCGFKVKSSQIRKRWDGILACRRCFDTKHPQLERLPVIKEMQAVKDARPPQTDTFDTITSGWEDMTRFTWEQMTFVNWEDWEEPYPVDSTATTATVGDPTPLEAT